MKSKNKKHRLLFQITAIVLPLFLLLAVIICQQVYSNSVDSFLEAQNSFIEERIDLALQNISLLDDNKFDDNAQGWLIDYLEKDGAMVNESLTEAEEDKLRKYFVGENAFTNEWFLALPEDIKQLYTRQFYLVFIRVIESAALDSDYENLFFMDLTDGYQGLVLLDVKKNGKSLSTGDHYDIDIDKHPAIKQLLETNSDEIVFERNDNFPSSASNYIGCKPIVINGKVRAVIGITYNWDALHSSLHSTIIRTMIISVSGMLIVMAVIILLLYRRAVKPVTDISNGLLNYTDDKDSAAIVKKMYDVKANNELGYLADVISDMTLEIDHYTKESVRTAVEHERMEKELYEAKVAVMTSQIRPHFMYNALTSIAMMCQIDPEKAQEATVTFAKYLRGNMDSLKQTKPVPFETELEHLKKYLYIEKLRFGKKLNIQYDIQATDFKLPMLSVQPLVENAVKHGVGMKKKGGTVTIISRETDSAFEVIIKDDGVGFDMNAPKEDDGRSHVGMENTRTRLKEMCGAEITIESTVDVGTTATITLPKEGQKDENTVS